MRNVVSSEIEKISRHIISHNCMLILCISKGRACRQDGRSVHHVRDMCSDGPAITRFAEAESIWESLTRKIYKSNYLIVLPSELYIKTVSTCSQLLAKCQPSESWLMNRDSRTDCSLHHRWHSSGFASCLCDCDLDSTSYTLCLVTACEYANSCTLANANKHLRCLDALKITSIWYFGSTLIILRIFVFEYWPSFERTPFSDCFALLLLHRTP